MNQELSASLTKTAEGRKILSILMQKNFSGEDSELLGKKFFKKIGKGIKKVGKYTSKVTGAIAKTAAGIVGIPPSAIDALARVDPTASKNLKKSLVQSKQGAVAAAIIAKTQQKKTGAGNIFKNINPLYFVGGAAAIGGLLLLTKKK